MSKYRHFTQEQIEQIVADTEREIDELAQKEFETSRLAQLQAYVDAHPQEVANHPLVRALRSIPSAAPAASAPAVQRTIPAPAPPQRPPTRAELERQKPWLRPAKPSTKLIDPHVR